MLSRCIFMLSTFCSLTRAAFVAGPRRQSLAGGAQWSTKRWASPTPTVPITLLSGFLGTGKTTALQHLLQNTQGAKIGVIVNDVASVNIDAKLISKQRQDDIVELQNGCACCSLADELFFSVEKLLNGRDLEAIVVELSGVADPMAIRNNWKMAPSDLKPNAEIAQVVTLVDLASFSYDYMTWDEANQREGWVNPVDPCAGNRKVAELLVEQVEAADVILLNKADIASAEEIQVTQKMIQALNTKARLHVVEFGVIDPKMVVGKFTKSTETHDHDHDCHDVATCTDPSHSHAHDHDCHDATCTGPSHSHAHENECNDAACTDTTHSHSHSHSTSTDNLGIVNFVYRSSRPFDASRIMALLNEWPVPIKDTLDIGLLQEAQMDGYEIDGGKISGSPFVGVLRSKGFCWFAPVIWSGANADAWRHDTAMYWSHAGKAFSISSAGKWWGTMSKDRMKLFFEDGNMDEFERILREDVASDEFFDRRQELVFIGTNLNEEEISTALNKCLLTDDELNTYRQKLRNHLDTIINMSPSLFNVGGVDQIDSSRT